MSLSWARLDHVAYVYRCCLLASEGTAEIRAHMAKSPDAAEAPVSPAPAMMAAAVAATTVIPGQEDVVALEEEIENENVRPL